MSSDGEFKKSYKCKCKYCNYTIKEKNIDQHIEICRLKKIDELDDVNDDLKELQQFIEIDGYKEKIDSLLKHKKELEMILSNNNNNNNNNNNENNNNNNNYVKSNKVND